MRGQQAVSIRTALGSLIIQERLQLSDRETLEQLTENPYLQYFIGLEAYQDRKPPFHHSLMTHFRKRLNAEVLQEINEMIAIESAKQEQDRDDDDSMPGAGKSAKPKQSIRPEADPNQGTLLLDATCAPADIAYPTDISLLHAGREKLEEIIDALHAPHKGTLAKPRTYREKARKAYLAVAKQRRIGHKKLRKAIGKQLKFIARDIRIIEQLAEITPLTALIKRQYKNLLVVQEMYRQQFEMYTNRTHQVDDRIVSIHQPHVRPMVRGKSKAKVEFGSKVSMSLVNGYAIIERMQWDSFHEGVTLIESVEAYKSRFGMYPKVVLADQLYRNRENLAYCRELPLDCIVLDWRSWTGELWGQKTLDPERFPDPDANMMEQLHALKSKLMVSIWPIMNSGGDNHREMDENGYLLGNQATYDAFQEGARQLYWQQANAGLFSHGIDAWLCDWFEADWKGAVKPEPEQRMLINTGEAKSYLDPEYINAYSLLHSKGIYEGQRSTTDSKRVVNLTRSAYAGQHRYGTITWSGDIAANWDTLKKQIADGLNICVTGSPYWTFDIGAFFVQNKPELWFWNGDFDKGVDDLGYRELYVRWFQLGAFLPMFRSSLTHNVFSHVFIERQWFK